MVYQIKVTSFASKAAQQFSPDIRKAAKAALRKLAQNPNSGKELQAELSSFRSYRFRRYRIVYKVNTENKQIVVWAIGHRRGIYEYLGEHLLQENSTRWIKFSIGCEYTRDSNKIKRFFATAGQHLSCRLLTTGNFFVRVWLMGETGICWKVFEIIVQIFLILEWLGK